MITDKEVAKLEAPAAINAAYVFLPAKPDTSDLYVPPRLGDEIYPWLLLRGCRENHFLRPPLFLGIGGPPGEGKSRMVEIICRRHGCDVFLLSAAQMAGEHEGDATQGLQQAYKDALKHSQLAGRMVILILENFHCSVAAIRTDVSYSVNSQLLEGCLLDMADELSGTLLSVILISNDFTTLGNALVRDGRMDFIMWKATWREKFKMVSAMLGLGPGPLRRAVLETYVLYYHLRGKPIAFFEQARNDAIKAMLPRATTVDNDVMRTANSLKLPTTMSLRLLLRMARQRHRRKPQSFLAPSRR
jgi:hypothetical protein